MSSRSDIRYEADAAPPHGLSVALALQTVAIVIAGIVLTPAVVMRAAGADAETTGWAVAAALAISGVTTILQAVKVGRFGAGYVLFMGTSGAFIAVAIAAVREGGLALLASLVVASSFVQFALAARLGALRRIITPTVGGTAIMLIAVTIMPIAYKLVTTAPAGTAPPAHAMPITAGATLVVMVALSLARSRFLKLWAPVMGIASGCALAAWFGMVDLARFADAPWIGLPSAAWPGFDLEFGLAFWTLLPAFAIVTVVGAVETYGDGIAIQRVSWRTPRATDFKAVQGAVYADGMGNLLSGLAGTLPNTTYSTAISVVDITGVAARRVGIYGGLFLMALAFSPKLSGLLLVVPDTVAGAYIIVLLVLLFMHGVRLVAEAGLSHENAVVVGLSFWLGAGFQGQSFFHDLLPPWATAVLDNGMTTGGTCALVMTLLLSLRDRSGRRLDTDLSLEAIPAVQAFLRELAAARGWEPDAVARLELGAEEALLHLLDRRPADGPAPRLRLLVRPQGEAMEIDIVAGPQPGNIEDALARMRAEPGAPAPEELPLRLLAHMASDIRHQQYHETDVISFRVAAGPA